MSSFARIEELEKKYAESPRRFFAPLANEFRKSGDTDRAIELCRAHLEQQPNHMSGQVVLGQALFDAGHLVESREAFQLALSLDPENLIALRHLGDMAREGGDFASAHTWYKQVLDVDSRNPEVIGLLRELEDAMHAESRPRLPAVDRQARASGAARGIAARARRYRRRAE
jgi:cytochrome c-type biogenesis protein CcmH/NrfG